MVFDPMTTRIYASIAATNTIAVINPVSGAVEKSIPTGVSPGRIALSPDGKYLYVGIDGLSQIQRFTLPAWTPDLLISLGTDTSGNPPRPIRALSLLCLGGTPATLVVATGYTNLDPPFRELLVFDDNIQRNVPVFTRFNLPGDGQIDNLQPSNTPGVFFANKATGTSDTTVFIFNLNKSQLTLTKSLAYADRNGNYDGDNIDHQMFFRNNKLFFSNGTVLDADTGARLGCLPVHLTFGKVVPASSGSRVYYCSGTGANRILIGDSLTFSPVGSTALPATRDDVIWKMIPYGDVGLALGSQTKTYLVPVNTLVGYAAPQIDKFIASTLSSPAPGSPVTLQWQYTDAFHLTLRGTSWEALDTFPGSRVGGLTVNPMRTTTYTFVAQDQIGFARSTDITVSVPDTTPLNYVDLPLQDIIYHRNSQKVFGTVNSYGGSAANSLVVIDPVTLKIEKTIPLGSEPNKITQSMDGSTLYVSLDGFGGVQPIPVASLTPNPPWRLGRFGKGPGFDYGTEIVADMVPLPDSPGSLAITQNYFNGPSSLFFDRQTWIETVAYDQGTPRPVPYIDYGQGNINKLQASATPGTLFGYENDQTSFQVSLLSLSPNGVQFVRSRRLPSLMFYNEFRAYGNRLFFSDGQVYDADTLDLLNTLPGFDRNSHGFGTIALDPEEKTIFLLNGNGLLNTYQMDDFHFLGSFDLQVPGKKILSIDNKRLLVLTRDRLYYIDKSWIK